MFSKLEGSQRIRDKKIAFSLLENGTKMFQLTMSLLKHEISVLTLPDLSKKKSECLLVKPFSPKSYLSISGKSSVGFIVVSIPGIAVLMTGLWSPSESKKKGSYQFSCNFIIDAIHTKESKREKSCDILHEK